MVTVRKYAAASLLEVFKDLLPGYRLQEHDLTQKLKKETIATYKYENALINSYKKYLIKLEEYTKALGSDQPPLKVGGVCGRRGANKGTGLFGPDDYLVLLRRVSDVLLS